MGARFGMLGYVGILVAIKDQASDSPALARRLGVGGQGLNIVLRRLRDMGLIHIEAWTPPAQKHLVMLPMWRYGSRDDAPLPLTQRRREPTKHFAAAKDVAWQARCNLTALKVAFEAMSRRPQSKAELMVLTGLSEDTLARLLPALHQHRFVRITCWLRGRQGPAVPCYEWGDGHNAPRPVPVASREFTLRQTIERRRERGVAAGSALAGVQYRPIAPSAAAARIAA